MTSTTNVPVRPVTPTNRASDEELVGAVADRVEDPAFPCLGAKAAFHRGGARVHAYDELGSAAATTALAHDLGGFVRSVDPDERFVTFLAVFRGPETTDEQHFESLLWHQLSTLAELDDEPWSTEVSSDPGDAHFGFSFGGTAMFVVGLHPLASRLARRAGSPVLVFNPHRQFERLRDENRFVRMRDVIRRRDEHLQGSINPMVTDFGRSSEARQYSGRAVGRDWQPPEPVSR